MSCTMYSVHRKVYTVHTMYTTQCMGVQSTHYVHDTVYSVQSVHSTHYVYFTVYSIKFTQYTLFILYSVQYTVYTVENVRVLCCEGSSEGTDVTRGVG